LSLFKGFESVALHIITYSPPLSGAARGVVSYRMVVLCGKPVQCWAKGINRKPFLRTSPESGVGKRQ
ncbi:MAG: hypothetical protein LUF68_00200, partial [Clostridiales bacterium]|nr:hypothetical protein [Clostridiales bacterium]